MLDERRVKLMTRLAMYEETGGKEDFKVSEFYRKDYVGMHSITAWLWVTVGYVGFLGLISLVSLDAIMGKMSTAILFTLAAAVVIGYLFVVILYVVIANHIYNEKHKNARQHVKKYNHDLTRLLKMYEKEKK